MNGRLFGALAAAGPSSRFHGDHEDVFRAALIDAARSIEARLGGASGGAP